MDAPRTAPPAVPVPTRLDRRRAAYRGRLLAAVGDLLSDGGTYADLTVEQIVSRADSSRSNFYVYFKDKGNLLAEFVVDVMGELIESTRSWLDLGPYPTQPEVQVAMRTVVTAYRKYAPLMVAMADTAGSDARVREVFEELMGLGQRQVAAHVLRGQQDGWATDAVAADDLAGWLVWMAERGLARFASAAANPSEADKVADAMAHIVWHSVYGPVAARSPAAPRRRR